MNLIFSDKAWEEYMYWQNTDKQILKKINQLSKHTNYCIHARLRNRFNKRTIGAIKIRIHYEKAKS